MAKIPTISERRARREREKKRPSPRIAQYNYRPTTNKEVERRYRWYQSALTLVDTLNNTYESAFRGMAWTFSTKYNEAAAKDFIREATRVERIIEGAKWMVPFHSKLGIDVKDIETPKQLIRSTANEILGEPTTLKERFLREAGYFAFQEILLDPLSYAGAGAVKTLSQAILGKTAIAKSPILAKVLGKGITPIKSFMGLSRKVIDKLPAGELVLRATGFVKKQFTRTLTFGGPGGQMAKDINRAVGQIAEQGSVLGNAMQDIERGARKVGNLRIMIGLSDEKRFLHLLSSEHLPILRNMAKEGGEHLTKELLEIELTRGGITDYLGHVLRKYYPKYYKKNEKLLLKAFDRWEVYFKGVDNVGPNELYKILTDGLPIRRGTRVAGASTIDNTFNLFDDLRMGSRTKTGALPKEYLDFVRKTMVARDLGKLIYHPYMQFGQKLQNMLLLAKNSAGDTKKVMEGINAMLQKKYGTAIPKSWMQVFDATKTDLNEKDMISGLFEILETPQNREQIFRMLDDFDAGLARKTPAWELDQEFVKMLRKSGPKGEFENIIHAAARSEDPRIVRAYIERHMMDPNSKLSRWAQDKARAISKDLRVTNPHPKVVDRINSFIDFANRGRGKKELYTKEYLKKLLMYDRPIPPTRADMVDVAASMYKVTGENRQSFRLWEDANEFLNLIYRRIDEEGGDLLSEREIWDIHNLLYKKSDNFLRRAMKVRGAPRPGELGSVRDAKEELTAHILDYLREPIEVTGESLAKKLAHLQTVLYRVHAFTRGIGVSAAQKRIKEMSDLTTSLFSTKGIIYPARNYVVGVGDYLATHASLLLNNTRKIKQEMATHSRELIKLAVRDVGRAKELGLVSPLTVREAAEESVVRGTGKLMAGQGGPTGVELSSGGRKVMAAITKGDQLPKIADTLRERMLRAVAEMASDDDIARLVTDFAPFKRRKGIYARFYPGGVPKNIRSKTGKLTTEVYNELTHILPTSADFSKALTTNDFSGLRVFKYFDEDVLSNVRIIPAGASQGEQMFTRVGSGLKYSKAQRAAAVKASLPDMFPYEISGRRVRMLPQAITDEGLEYVRKNKEFKKRFLSNAQQYLSDVPGNLTPKQIEALTAHTSQRLGKMFVSTYEAADILNHLTPKEINYIAELSGYTGKLMIDDIATLTARKYERLGKQYLYRKLQYEIIDNPKFKVQGVETFMPKDEPLRSALQSMKKVNSHQGTVKFLSGPLEGKFGVQLIDRAFAKGGHWVVGNEEFIYRLGNVKELLYKGAAKSGLNTAKGYHKKMIGLFRRLYLSTTLRYPVKQFIDDPLRLFITFGIPDTLRSFGKATQMLTDYYIGSKGAKAFSIVVGGRRVKMTLPEIFTDMIKEGSLTGMAKAYGAEFGAALIPGTKYMGKMNIFLEQFRRLTGWLAALKQAKVPTGTVSKIAKMLVTKQAAKRVAHSMFDYHMMTAAERGGLSHLVLFHSYVKGNLRFLFKEWRQQPNLMRILTSYEKHLADLIHGGEVYDPSKGYLYEHERERGVLVWADEKDKKKWRLVTGIDFGTKDINLLWPTRAWDRFKEMLTPAIRTALELRSDKYLFSDMGIKDYNKLRVRMDTLPGRVLKKYFTKKPTLSQFIKIVGKEKDHYTVVVPWKFMYVLGQLPPLQMYITSLRPTITNPKTFLLSGIKTTPINIRQRTKNIKRVLLGELLEEYRNQGYVDQQTYFLMKKSLQGGEIPSSTIAALTALQWTGRSKARKTFRIKPRKEAKKRRFLNIPSFGRK